MVIPVWNEQRTIGAVVEEIRKKRIVDKILVIDDGSTDNSKTEAKRNGALVIKHMKNRGVGAAIRTGVNYAIKNNYKIIVITNGHGKNLSSEIPCLLEPILCEGFDFVQGSRYIVGGSWMDMPFHRLLGTKIYSLFFSLAISSFVTDGSCGFRAFKTHIFADKRIKIKQRWLDRYELEPYLYFKALKLGYRVKEVPITVIYHQPSDQSYTKMRAIVDWWRITRPLVYLALGIRK